MYYDDILVTKHSRKRLRASGAW